MVRYVAFLLSSTSLNLKKKSRKEARFFIAGKQIPFLGMSMARPDMIKESTRNHENFHNVVNRGCVVSYWVLVSTSSILILFVYFFFRVMESSHLDSCLFVLCLTYYDKDFLN